MPQRESKSTALNGWFIRRKPFYHSLHSCFSCDLKTCQVEATAERKKLGPGHVPGRGDDGTEKLGPRHMPGRGDDEKKRKKKKKHGKKEENRQLQRMLIKVTNID